MDAYIEQLRRYGTVRRTDASIELALEEARADIGGAPKGASLTIRPTGNLQALHLASLARGDPPCWVHLMVPAGTTDVRFDLPARCWTEVWSTNGSLALSFGDGATPCVRLIGSGQFTLRTNMRFTALQIDQREEPLKLLATSAMRVGLLCTSGTIALTGEELHADRLRLKDATTLSLENSLECGALRSRGKELRVEGAETLAIGTVDGVAQFTLSGSSLALGPSPVSQPKVSVGGHGSVKLDGHVAHVELIGEHLNLEVVGGSRIDSLSGCAAVTAQPDAVVVGSDKTCFEPTSIRLAEGAVIRRLSPFRLQSVKDIDRLAKASYVSMLLPRSDVQLRQRADSMTIASADELKQSVGRVDFWERVAALLHTHHVGSRTQSSARYLAARARRLASEPSWSRERLLHTAYGAVGYGERLLRPIVIYILAALAVAWRLSRESLSDLLTDDSSRRVIWQSWSRVLQAPLAFFEFGMAPDTHDASDELILVGFQVVGVVLIVVFLLAIRRIVAVGVPSSD